ncbi:MAG TPA: R3H domain-containing nucleic acid-binding protein [Candidatus Cybelea sp.]|nr:R3H domain-containing nucleic acid-binding protein [Candidatus Cybelea sp.]
MSEAQPSRPPRRSGARRHPDPSARLDPGRVTESLRTFLDLTLRQMNLEAKYEIAGPSDSPAGVVEDGTADGRQGAADVVVRFTGGDEEILLARNGELLLALEYLAHRWLRLEPELHDRVHFDCADFRASRLDELKLSARVAAQRVRETGQVFRFNPMSSRDRRTIHLELSGAPGVRTISEGSGDRRHLVIYPATKKSPANQ